MRGLKYKPYRLKDYKQNFAHEEPKPLGGMGPNVGTPEWQAKAHRREKMVGFAKEAEHANKLRLAGQRPAQKQQVQKRRFGVNGPLWEMV